MSLPRRGPSWAQLCFSSPRIVTATVAITVAAVAASACSPSRAAPRSTVVPTSAAPVTSTTVASSSTTSARTSVPATTPAPPPTPVAPAPISRVTGVGTVVIDVQDSTRATVQAGRTLSSYRKLPTVVRYPATGATGPVEVPGAAPAPGRWPLVIFAHGYNVTPETYHHLLHAWTSAGFVVAAPAFPLEAQGGPLDENDLQNEPADISVVISAVLARSLAGSGPLSGLVDAGRIAVTGHSDGAEAALPVGFSARADPRVGPIVSMAAEGIIGGPHPDAHHPLLVVQGTDDTINPPGRSDGVYAAAGAPRYYLHLLGAGHLPPVADDNAWRPVVEVVTIAFLRRTLSKSVPAAAILSAGEHPGLSTMTANP